MIYWDPKKLTKDLGEFLRSRLQLLAESTRISEEMADIDFAGINLEARFENGEEGNKRLLVVSILPFKKELDGLMEYLKKEVETKAIFANGNHLQAIGRKEEFWKYFQRLEYIGVEEGERTTIAGNKKIVSLTYSVAKRSFKLSRKSFRDTIFYYVFAPFLDWALRKK